MTKSMRQTMFDLAVKTIRSYGIKVRRNVQSCCRGCVTPNQLGVKSSNHPIIWHFGGQGDAFTWDMHGNAVYRHGDRFTKGQPVDTIYFNWSNLSDEQARAVVAVFRNHGFDAEWDGNDMRCIQVHPNKGRVHVPVHEYSRTIATFAI